MVARAAFTSERSLLDEHAVRVNDGVRSGGWTPLLELFEVDAELGFEGVYAWKSAPEARAGELRLSAAGGRIARLVVTFG